MTKAQQRETHRIAVEVCLHKFYGLSSYEAHVKAVAWWKRIIDSPAFESGFFTHAEPMQTAANILHQENSASIDDNLEAYEIVLRESEKQARKNLAPKKQTVPRPETQQTKSPMRAWESKQRAAALAESR